MGASKPLVVVSACRKEIPPHHYHVIGEKYAVTALELAGVIPLALPAFGDKINPAELLPAIDGVLLTGSYSNVEPRHYQGPPSTPDTVHDPQRDATTLPLIRAAVDAGVPIFAICRGCQEMNVAFGGSLHQRVHEAPGMNDHREPAEQPVEVQYGPSHKVAFVPGGLLQALAGQDTVTVNSVHWQGIDRLGDGLSAEAVAPDGLIEAFRVTDAPDFTLAVQWHPEWRAADNPLSRALFGAFGEACRRRSTRRRTS